MTVLMPDYDAVIVGGGFYGAAIAVYLAKQRHLKRVLLIEQEPALLMRASYNNQARVHNGYHYPRCFTTAYRSRVNAPRFLLDWPKAVSQNLIKLYAIASHNSKVTAKQFERFCRDIDARIEPAPRVLRMLFEPRLIEDVFLVEEHAFDATQLAVWARQELENCGVQVRYQTRVSAILKRSDSGLNVIANTQKAADELLSCRYVFNCTYSGTNQLSGDFPGLSVQLKQEVSEVALMQMPPILEGLGITVMDGPFFSMMPFPSRGLHSLSHVRFTPHLHWNDQPGADPYKKLRDHEKHSRADRMLRDASRYIPVMAEARHVDSLFEIKTVLLKSEGDDGRPIVFEKHAALPGCYSVLGSKIDNIYDVLEKMDDEVF